MYLEQPIPGSRRLHDLLRVQGIEVGRRHVGTLIRHMDVQALHRKSNSNKKHPAHQVFLCVQRESLPTRSGRRTSPPSRWRGGPVYLVVMLDLYSRQDLAHRVRITMRADFCVEVPNEPVAPWGAL